MQIQNLRAYLLITALAIAGVGGTASRSEARAGPKIIPTNTPEPSPTASPSPTPTQVPSATPSPTVTPSPTPTIDPVILITANYKVDRVLIWLGEIQRINEVEELELDPVLIMSVMAAESGGDWTVVSYAGACGLMQVIPQPWYELSKSAICDSNVGNLYIGMYILKWSIRLAEGDLRYGLAYYNCSYDSVHADRCGTKGGLHYADKVLNFWYPLIESRLEN